MAFQTVLGQLGMLDIFQMYLVTHARLSLSSQKSLKTWGQGGCGAPAEFLHVGEGGVGQGNCVVFSLFLTYILEQLYASQILLGVGPP